MKKILAVLIGLILSVTFALPVMAQGEMIDKSELVVEEVRSFTEYHEDGSYTEVTVISEAVQDISKSDSMSMLSSSYYKSGTKMFRQFNSSGQMIYTFSLHATFLIQPGVYVRCINSSYSHSIYNSTWSLSSGSSYYTNDRAYGNATFIKRVLFVPIETHHVSITLSCTASGSFY